MDGFGAAVDRYNSRMGEESQHEPEPEKKPATKSTEKAHHYQVHVHKDGTHHLTAHKSGQLVHHSEHGSMEEAADAMKQHASGGGIGSEAEGPEQV